MAVSRLCISMNINNQISVSHFSLSYLDGSHVAGTVAAVQNGRGVVGVNRNGEIGLHIERLFGSNGNFIFGSSLVQLARNCVSAGSNVISMSLGGPQSSAFEESQFRQIFESNDVLVVAAAGNGGNTRCSYPVSSYFFF